MGEWEMLWEWEPTSECFHKFFKFSQNFIMSTAPAGSVVWFLSQSAHTVSLGYFVKLIIEYPTFQAQKDVCYWQASKFKFTLLPYGLALGHSVYWCVLISRGNSKLIQGSNCLGSAGCCTCKPVMSFVHAKVVLCKMECPC